MEELATPDPNPQSIPTQEQTLAEQALKMCQEEIKTFQNLSFSLGISLEQLPYIRDSSIRISKFQQTKETYLELKQKGDAFFHEDNPNFLLGKQPIIMKSQIKQSSDLITQDDGLDAIDALSEKLQSYEIQNMYTLITYQKAIQCMISWLLTDLQKSEAAERNYYGLLKLCENPPGERSKFEEIFLSSFKSYSKARENEIYSSIEKVSKLIVFLNESVKEQQNTLNFNKLIVKKNKENEEQKWLSQKHQDNFQNTKPRSAIEIAFIDELVKEPLSVVQTTRLEYIVAANALQLNQIRLMSGDEMFYLQYGSTVNVINTKFQRIRTFDLRENVFLGHLFELDKQILIAICNNSILKFSLPYYDYIKQAKSSTQVNHILSWKGNLAVISFNDGELNLFDCNQLKPISKAKVSVAGLYESIKSSNDDNQLISCGEEGVFLSEINNNEIRDLYQQYFRMEKVTRILQLRDSLYALCFRQKRKILIGLLDINSHSQTDLENPKRIDQTNAIDKVQGLEEIAVIQTSKDIFLMKCETLELTHVISSHIDHQNIISKYDKLRKCLKLFKLQSEIDKENKQKVRKLIVELEVKLS